MRKENADNFLQSNFGDEVLKLQLSVLLQVNIDGYFLI